MIEDYKFGEIKISGKVFNYDVEVRWDGKVLKWWRKEGHVFDVEDLKRAIEQNPDTIVLGTGAYGTAKVTEKAKKFVAERKIELIVKETEKAVETFNLLLKKPKAKVIGLFHLTC